MTQRLRAESTGEIMTLLGRHIVGLLSLESCCGRTHNSEVLGRPVAALNILVARQAAIL